MISNLLRPQPMDKITDRIYIGTYHSAKMLEYENRAGMTHVLNCTPDAHKGLRSLHVYQLNINDGYEIPVDSIQYAIGIIGRAVESGGRILVHCHSGISRSVSIVCAYLIHAGFSWDEALRYVQAHRPQAYPHPNIERSIKQYFGNYINVNTTLLGDSNEYTK